MRKELIENNPILKQTILFSLMVIEYCEVLNTAKKFVISKQLLRAATSIGANAREAQNAESKADFIHRMKVAAKEADETQYWLILCSYLPDVQGADGLLQELEKIQKIINAILGTAKRNLMA